MSDIFGKKLGQYVLLEQLGEGGMAKVYNALDERVERNVAIKVILPNKRSSQVFLQQFDREAKALANLTHTNIVKVLDYGSEDGQPYLVMDFIQGGTLKDALAGALPWQKAAEILAPIARALDYVHHQNIVHQDIKPSNILLDEDFRPMLSDFGVVKLLEAKGGENAAIGVGVGTPDYMSPEQGTGKDVDFRADIYSLGVVYYEMVTGEKPFVADTPMALVIKHVTDEIPLPSKKNPKIPQFVENAIMRAVQKNPEDRYASMAEFADVLELIVLGEQASEKKVLALTHKNKRRKKANLALAFGLPVLLLVALAAIFIGISMFNPEWARGISALVLPPTATSIPTVYATKIPVAATAQPAITKVVFTATPTQEITATPSPTEVPPSPTDEPSPVTDVGLLGTPIAKVGKSGFTEIARWGIGGINKIKWSPDGAMIAAGTTNGIYLYDTASKEMKRFIDAGSAVISLDFSPDGTMLLAGTLNGRVRLYDMQTGAEYPINFTALSAVSTVSFSRNGKSAAVGFENGDFILVSIDQKVLITENQYPTIKSAFTSEDGRLLFVSNGEATISVWDVASRQIVEKMKSPISVNKLVPSPDRQFMLSAGDTNVAFLWDLTAQPIQSVIGFPNLGGKVASLEFSPDNQLIIIGLNTGEVKVFTRPEKKDYSRTQTPILTIPVTAGNVVRSIAFSPTQMVFASGTWEDGLKTWDAQTGNNIAVIQEGMSGISKLEFSPDAAWLATSHEGNIVRVWDVQAAKKAYQFDGYLTKGVAFSPNSRYLAVVKTKKSNEDAAKIQVVELSSGKIIREVLGYKPGFFLQFSDNSQLLVAGSLREATIWDSSTWEKVTSSGAVTAGCGQFVTPQNNRLAIVSSIGLLFTYSGTDANICETPFKSATFVYYFKKQARTMFVLGTGEIWTWDFRSPDTAVANRQSGQYPNPSEIFLGANGESGLYASVVNASVAIKNISGGTNNTIPNQDYYRYQVAFLPTQKMFALGSKYGSIHIWSLP